MSFEISNVLIVQKIRLVSELASKGKSLLLSWRELRPIAIERRDLVFGFACSQQFRLLVANAILAVVARDTIQNSSILNAFSNE